MGNSIDVNEIDVTDDGLLLVTVQTGNTDTRNLNIANTGVSDLNWSIRSMTEGATAFTFTKENSTDEALAENQDRITDKVWITRVSDTGSGHGGIFNAFEEGSGRGPGNGPPTGTEWNEENSLGSTSYSNWGSNIEPHEHRGVTQSMHLIEDDLYFDVIFNEWGNMGFGGFSYTRWETPGWLKADIISGTTTGASNTDIILTFDPGDLVAGTYLANIILTSNDANESEITIPVELIVTGIPVLSTNTGSDINIDPTYIDLAQESVIVITNTGTDDLIITDIVTSSSDITLNPTNTTITPGASLEVLATITPTVLGPFAETVTITSNDGAVPDTDYVINVAGTVLDAPNIAVTPTSFDIDINSGDVGMEVITISNSGAATLNWSLSNVPAWITPDIDLGSILSGDPDVEINLTIDLTSDSEGVYETVINVDSDDPDSPLIEIVGFVEYGGIFVTSPLPDVLVNEGFSSQEIDFSNVFTHLNPLTYIIATSDTDVVSAIESPSEFISIGETGVGSSFITIRADDGASVAYENFIFRVNDIPDITSVTNIILDEGFVSENMNMSTFFTDSDAEDSPSYTVVSATPAVVTAEVAGSTLTLTEVGIGSSVITADIDDNSGGTNTNNITFRVNDIPNLDNALADINAVRDAATQDVSLATVFSDSDAGDVLSYTAVSSDVLVATVSVTGSTLSITEVGSGSTTITVTVDDGITTSTLPTDDFLFTITCPIPVITTTGEYNVTADFVLTSSIATGNQWYRDGAAISGATDVSLTVTEVGSYTVQSSSNTGDCISGLSAAIVVACPMVTPTITTTGIDNESDEFMLTSSSVTGNQWFLDGIAISGATSASYSVTQGGSYTVQVNYPNGGCTSSMSGIIVITGRIGSGLATDISIWPNPVHNNLTLNGLDIKDYHVFNTQGKEVVIHQKVHASNGMYQIDVSSLKKGVYIINISTNSGSEHQMRFVKE